MYEEITTKVLVSQAGEVGTVEEVGTGDEDGGLGYTDWNLAACSGPGLTLRDAKFT